LSSEGTEFRHTLTNCYWMEMMFGSFFFVLLFVKVLGILLSNYMALAFYGQCKFDN
jgi:hypothetical protein